MLPLFLVRPSSAQQASVVVDVGAKGKDFQPAWAWFGHDEPNYTYMKDGKKLLAELAELSPVPVYMRVHNLLTTGDGSASLKWGSTNAYTEDKNGMPVYNWSIVDSIFDTYIRLKMKPFAQIGFMPEAMSTNPVPYRHTWGTGKDSKFNTGWTYPPKDYGKWEELTYQWVKHCVERYGKAEVESWYWEVWNEPNIEYWSGTMEEYFKLYDYAAQGLKRALPTARIGGPEIAGTSGPKSIKFLTAFIEHCISGTNYATGERGSPLDLISFHAKGSPKLKNGHVQMNMAPELRDIAAGFRITASYPQTKNLPVIIGESDPEGCAACSMASHPQNAYRNGTMYSSYTAASFARIYALADSFKINLRGIVSWSFEFEDQPWFYGYRDLATNGIDKPVLNVFRMYGMMKGKKIAVTDNTMQSLDTVLSSGVKGDRDIGALATTDGLETAVMLWNYHDDDLLGKDASVDLVVRGLKSKTVRFVRYVIDKQHANSYEAWLKMGSPQKPSDAQIRSLEKASALLPVDQSEKKVVNGELKLSVPMAGQAVSLILIK